MADVRIRQECPCGAVLDLEGDIQTLNFVRIDWDRKHADHIRQPQPRSLDEYARVLGYGVPVTVTPGEVTVGGEPYQPVVDRWHALCDCEHGVHAHSKQWQVYGQRQYGDDHLGNFTAHEVEGQPCLVCSRLYTEPRCTGFKRDRNLWATASLGWRDVPDA